jgi:Fic family protein
MRRMHRHIYDQTDWPRFIWSRDSLAERLAAVRHGQGRLLGKMEALGFQLRQEAVLQTLTEDVLKSSEIEGENLDRDQVRSSLARRLGMDAGGLKAIDRNIEGVVEMMLDATRLYDKPLTVKRLFAWHSALFPTGRTGMNRIRVGRWRDDGNGPMQVVSGPIGREHVHFEAPPATRLGTEMAAFLHWLNGNNETDWVVKAALAHLWFVTIHPFEDGNGRIARAIADLALARSEKSSQRFYSMSAQIRRERDAYYGILERTQKGSLDVTPWMEWFLSCLEHAIADAQTTLAKVLHKARFWEFIGDFAPNERQRLMINKLLDNFEGKLSTSKWAKMTKTSHDTALRDIQSLLERNILVRSEQGGRSTSYELAKLA